MQRPLSAGAFLPGDLKLSWLAVLWGVGGMCVLLIFAVVRLAGIGLDSLAYPFAWYHWVLLLANTAFMAYSEGYKGFQKAYSPRFAARVRHLRDNPRFSHSLLAPLFGMGFFHTTRERMRVSYPLTVVIVVFIIVVHQLPQPWRGIVDIGVVVGLCWGLISLIIYSWQALRWNDFPYSPELPVRT